MTTQTLDAERLDAIVGSAVGDFGATLGAALVVLGDRLGLFRALAEIGPATPAELAARTGTVERNAREWLSAQAAARYVTYDGHDTWSLSAEQREAFTNADSPAFVIGGFQAMLAATRSIDQAAEAFRTGRGLGWHEHHHDLFEGTERFFRPGYAASLVSQWLPAFEGGTAKLELGAKVADVGCGHGPSTVLMAQAFPASTFVGFDYHEASIIAARNAAEDAGVTGNTRFEVAAADAYPGHDYDLVCYFDCLHDMGDPVGALIHARQALSRDGAVMLVEPQAGDQLEDNLHAIGRVFYGASTLICTLASQSQDVGRALGAQAGPARLNQVANEAGFTRVRTTSSNPFNQVLELRP